MTAASTALLDYIFVGSSTSILLPSAATVSGKSLTLLMGAQHASYIASVVAAAGDTVEGVSGFVMTNIAASFSKAIFFTPGSVTWYNLASTAELI